MRDLDAIRERHRKVGVSQTWACAFDGQPWGEKGCDTAQALARVAELEAALDFRATVKFKNGYHGGDLLRGIAACR
jgi:hypothetical protein